MTLGGRISLARESANFTRHDLAKRLGVLDRTIDNWEADRAEPRGNRLAMLAGVLGVSFQWLLTGVGEDSHGALDETRALGHKMERLNALHRQAAVLAKEIQSDIKHLQSRLDAYDA